MRSKIGLILVVLTVFSMVSGSFAYTQTSFVLDPGNPQFEFLENALNTGEVVKTLEFLGAGDDVVYVDLPRVVAVTSASLNLAGQHVTQQTPWSLDLQTFESGKPSSPQWAFDNDESTKYYVAAMADYFDTNSIGYFTIPDYAYSFSHKVAVSCPSGCGGCRPVCTYYVSLYNFSNNQWVNISHDTNTDSDPYWINISNYSLTQDLLAGNKIKVKYQVVKWESGFYIGLNGIAGDFQRSSYTIKRYPENVTVDVGNDGNVDWQQGGTLDSIIELNDANANLTNQIQDYLDNNCFTGMCSVPLKIHSDQPGKVELGAIEINYTYAPTVSVAQALNQTTGIVPNQSYYVADRLSFGSATFSGIQAHYVDIPDNATICWQDGVQKSLATEGGNVLCDVNDFTFIKEGRRGALPPTSVWSDGHQRDIAVTQSEGNYEPAASKQSTAGGRAYIQTNVTLSNLADTGEALSGPWSLSAPKNGWSCEPGECDGEYASLNDGGSTIKATAQHCDDAITLVEGGWQQDDTQKSNMITQYIEESVGGTNTENIGFTDVSWSVTPPPGWSGVATSGTFAVGAGASWSATATAESSKITQSESSWTEDATFRHTLLEQRIKKTITLQNNDPILQFSSIDWATQCLPGWVCSATSGTSAGISADSNLSVEITATGDGLVESMGQWQEDTSFQQTVDSQRASKSLVVNNSAGVGFTQVEVPLAQSPLGWDCDDLEDSCNARYVNIAANGYTNANEWAVQDDVIGESQTSWQQDVSKVSTADVQHVKNTVSLSNTGGMSFSAISYAPDACPTDSCDATPSAWSVPIAGNSTTLYGSGDKIDLSESGWAQDESVQSTLSEQRIKQTVTLTNNYATVQFNNITLSGGCPGVWNCTNAPGSSEALSPAGGTWQAAHMARGDALNESFGTWQEDVSFTQTVGTQRIAKSLSVQNTGGINLTQIEVPSAPAPRGWDCDDPEDSCAVRFVNIGAMGYSNTKEWIVQDDVIVESQTGWVQDVSKTSTTDIQYTKKSIVLNNSGGIIFSSVEYAVGKCPTDSCDTMPVSWSVPIAGNSTSFYGSGDRIDLSESGWAQDESHTSTFSEQKIKQIVTLTNNYASVQFNNLSWGVSCPGEWNCNNTTGLTGTLNTAGGTWQATPTAVQDIIDECNTWNWEEDSAKVHTMTAQYLAGSCAVTNEDIYAFTAVSWSTSAPNGWAGDLTSGSVDIAGSETKSITATTHGNVLSLGGSWEQDARGTLQTQYLRKNVTISNADNYSFTAVQYIESDTVSPPFGSCNDCTGSIDVPAGGSSMVKHASGNALVAAWESEWSQERSLVSNSSIQFMKKGLNVVSSTQLPLSNITWDTTEPEWNGISGACDDCIGALNFEPIGSNSTIAKAHGDWVDVSEGSPAQDGVVNLLEQRVKKTITLTNNAGVILDQIHYTASKETGWTCLDCSIVTGAIQTSGGFLGGGNDWSMEAHYTGDLLQESWGTWAVDQYASHNLSEQFIERKLQVMNNGGIDFTSVTWENTTTPGDFTCTNCSGHADFATGQNMIIGLSAQGDVLEEQWGNWAQDLDAGQTVAGGSAYIKRPLTVQNNGTLDFTDVGLPRLEKDCWNCQQLVPTISVRAGALANASKVATCSRTGAVNKTSGAWAPLSSVVEVGGKLPVAKQVDISNTEADIVFAARATTRIPDALNDSVKLYYNGTEAHPVSFSEDNGLAEWDVSLDSLSLKTFKVVWESEGPYFASNDSKPKKDSNKYTYIRDLVVPNNYTKVADILVGLDTSSWPDWGKRKKVAVYVDGKKLEHVFANSGILNATVPDNFTSEQREEQSATRMLAAAGRANTYSLDTGSHNLLVEYTISTDSGGDSGGGGGGGGGSSTPQEQEEELIESPGTVERTTNERSVIQEEPVEEMPDPTTPGQAPEEPLSPTGLFTLTHLKNPLVAAMLGALMLGALVIYGVNNGRFQTPKVKAPKIRASAQKGRKAIAEQTPVEKSVIVEKRIELPDKMNATMQGLSEREQEIMKALIEHEGEATQARIYHATGLSTSALSRWVNTLEQKNLIETWYVGKLRKIKLSKKFLELSM